MSSIYRKGRDGFFYYQTYVRNPKTGKKDKRIFHSLGTKDRLIAQEKQLEYDNKYEAKKHVNYEKQSRKVFLKKFLLSIGIIFGLLFVFQNIERTVTNRTIITGIDSVYLDKNYNDERDKIETYSTGIIKNGENKNELNQENNFDKTKPNDLKENHNIIKTIIPTYKIERMETLSKAFEQAKFFILVAGQTSSESLLSICKKITKEHNQFSNIVICLYSDSKVGRQLAQGNEFSIGAKDYKSAWLAMYTYNPVEGDYFDDNPSQHLGAH